MAIANALVTSEKKYVFSPDDGINKEGERVWVSFFFFFGVL